MEMVMVIEFLGSTLGSVLLILSIIIVSILCGFRNHKCFVYLISIMALSLTIVAAVAPLFGNVLADIRESQTQQRGSSILAVSPGPSQALSRSSIERDPTHAIVHFRLDGIRIPDNKLAMTLE